MRNTTSSRIGRLLVTSLFVSLVLGACYSVEALQWEDVRIQETLQAIQATLDPGQTTAETSASGNEIAVPGDAEVSFTLQTGDQDGKLVYFGVGGKIDGQVNPTLVVEPGQTVEIKLVNGVPVEHDLRIDELGVASGSITAEGEEISIVFEAGESGSFAYYCSVPGHRLAGMEGQIQVGAAVAAEEAASIVRSPADVPAPVGDRGPQLVQVELTAQEVVGQLADGASYTYFTFDGQVPGPFLRVRQGDTVELSLTNALESTFIHSIDLHAVTGPGGGAVYTQTNPGETNTFTFQALNPGVYIYHCATPSHAHHITNGMYGIIVVEPAGGLPPVDREFYVVQAEMYTAEPFGSSGLLSFSHEKMLDETPEYFVFNGAAGALTSEENALRAEVGETVRIYIGVAGPNFTSSFHVIGEIFDTVYPFGSLTSEPLTDVQTINVNPGAAWAVDFRLDVPGTYILVDHALSRLERGLVGLLIVEGDEAPEIFHQGPAFQ